MNLKGTVSNPSSCLRDLSFTKEIRKEQLPFLEASSLCLPPLK